MLERIVSLVNEREFIYMVGALLVVYLIERIITYCRLASISKFLKKMYKRVEAKDKEKAKELEPKRRQNTYNRRRERERQMEELPEMTTATSNYDEIDNTMYSWWFKRNDEHKASGCQEGIDFQKYNAYYAGDTKEKIIYLTFDCGYDNGLTEKMLDTLKKHKAPATILYIMYACQRWA